MSLADLAEFKAYLRIEPADETDDVQMQLALDTATSSIQHLCSRSFEVAGGPSPRYFEPWYNRRVHAWQLPIDDLFDPDGLLVFAWNPDDTDWTTPVVGAELRPTGAPSRAIPRPWTSLDLYGVDYTPGGNWGGSDNASFLRVLATWGWPSDVLAPVRQACLIQADRVFKRRDAVFGVTSSPDGSENTRLLNTLDVDVQVALRPYVKYWGAR